MHNSGLLPSQGYIKLQHIQSELKVIAKSTYYYKKTRLAFGLIVHNAVYFQLPDSMQALLPDGNWMNYWVKYELLNKNLNFFKTLGRGWGRKAYLFAWNCPHLSKHVKIAYTTTNGIYLPEPFLPLLFSNSWCSLNIKKSVISTNPFFLAFLLC